MRPWKNSLSFLVLAAASLAQTGTPLANESVRRVGETVRCMCGCSYTVTSCNMLNCSGAEPARAKLLQLVRQGLTDDEIRAEFVKQYGRVVLTRPPSDGFHLVGWVMPFLAAGLGLAIVVWFISRLQRSAPVPAPGKRAPDAGVQDPELARYRERIEKDLEKLD